MHNILRSVPFMLMIAVVLAGCGSPDTAAPTQIDAAIIHTSVALTMVAQLTQTAAAMPPTPIPLPSATVAPILTPTATLMPLSVPLDQLGSPTAEATDDDVKEKIVFLGQSPMAGQQYNVGSKFDAKFTFQNIGTDTWSPAFSIRFLGWGETFNASETVYTFEKYADNTTVEPKGVVTITLPGLQAPGGSGSFIGNLCLYNNRDDAGLAAQCIYPLYIDIFIGG